MSDTLRILKAVKIARLVLNVIAFVICLGMVLLVVEVWRFWKIIEPLPMPPAVPTAEP